MALTVYAWTPHVDHYGHASLELSDGTYISWWPRTKSKKDTRSPALLGGEPGARSTYEEDVNAEEKDPDEAITIPSKALNENKIKSWWSSYKGNYNVITNNCCNMVYNALRQGGAHSEMKPVWKPADIIKYAKKVQNKCQ